MHVADTLSANGFTVQQAQYFVDASTGKSREIDVIATYSAWIPSPSTTIAVNIIAECKYSRHKPWVLLTTEDAPQCHIVGTASARVCANEIGRTLTANLSENEKAIASLPFLAGPKNSAYSALTAFRNNESATDEAYAAPLSVAKACRALAQTTGTEQARVLEKALGYNNCSIWVPAVVVAGSMFSAHLEGPSELSVNPIEWGRLLLRNPDTGSTETAVDILTAKALDSYALAIVQSVSELKKQLVAEPQLATDALYLTKRIIGKLTATLGKNTPLKPEG
jgi:hypothetical protein